MNPRELAALMRRHVVAVAVVLVLAAGVGYVLKRTPPTYQESGTIVLATPSSADNPNPYNYFGDSLVDTGYILLRTLNSAQGQQQIRAAGANGSFGIALDNLYNQEYPNYQPYLLVSGTGYDPVSAHRTFEAVVKVMSDDLSAAQGRQGVQPINRIMGKMIGDSGPIIQTGSPKREFALFAVIVLIVLFTVLLFIERHPVRLRGPAIIRRNLPPRLTSRREASAGS